jgi:hypothetical protein
MFAYMSICVTQRLDLDLVRESYTMVECKNMLYVRQAHTKMRLFFRDTDTLEMFDQTNTVVQSDV